ncbi:hypothetical protein SAMN04487949_1754 [Halogranum gelatinilyticum]|uniref:Uncharacterized protein n=1 Tax=Halogranum gelatinilyticum TaxID=660521 RepID=A0A1G9TFD3_9EURY|nr:hypothetical protein [Halogranum gelatinilyticum]SDM46489.1 hypothetical protein SAMN04487949_1754 [Halogranum gelatinilyticum]
MSSETDTDAESDGGYVHRPGEDETVGDDGESAGSFGGQGWILVAIVVLSFLVVPGLIYVFPSIPASFGIPYLAAFLALPMIPALLLGLTAVWTMTAATNGRD